MKALIVPGVTDLNKGDQALVWESARLALDTKLFNSIFLLTAGDTPDEEERLCSQSRDAGYNLLNNILPHPRRGLHKETDGARDGLSTTMRMAVFAIFDFLRFNLLILFCGSKTITRAIFGKRINSFIDSFREIDVVFVKGGGFIHSYGGFQSPYLIWFFLFYIRLAKRLKKRVVVLPNSYGPFKGLTVSRQIRSALSDLDLISARERVSFEALNGLIDEDVILSPDLGFFLGFEGINKKKVSDLLSRSFQDGDKKIVGLTVRPWRFPGSSNPSGLYEKYIRGVADLVEHIQGKGYYVAICNQSIGPNAHEDDRNAIKDVMKLAPRVIWINENLTCSELKLLYSEFDYFVGTRFHSVIFSLTSKVPSIAIGYGGNKAKGIMSYFDLEDYTIPIEMLDGKKLIKMFDNLENEKVLIKEKLEEKIEDVARERRVLISKVRNALKV